jgi:putative membrane protein
MGIINVAFSALAGLCALLHAYFMLLEMYFWTKPLGLKVFGMRPEVAEASKALALNQGLYNGFLVAGLVWAFVSQDNRVFLFFLGCMLVAGIVGALSVHPKIFFVQGLPALLALVLLYFRWRTHA